MNAALITSTKGDTALPRLLSAAPTDTVSEVLARMDEHGVTQMPVIEEGRSVGAARESRLLAKVLGNRDRLQAPVSEVMEESLPVVDAETGVAEITRILRRSPAVLVEEYGRITGILTRHDILDVREKK
jgi:predicted transcriptional regulator